MQPQNAGDMDRCSTEPPKFSRCSLHPTAATDRQYNTTDSSTIQQTDSSTIQQTDNRHTIQYNRQTAAANIISRQQQPASENRRQQQRRLKLQLAVSTSLVDYSNERHFDRVSVCPCCATRGLRSLTTKNICKTLRCLACMQFAHACSLCMHECSVRRTRQTADKVVLLCWISLSTHAQRLESHACRAHAAKRQTLSPKP